MTSLNQEVDSIIATDGIDNSIPAVADDTQTNDQDNSADDNSQNDKAPDDSDIENKQDDSKNVESNNNDTDNDDSDNKQDEQPKIDATPPPVEVKPQDPVTFLQSLDLTEDKILKEDGSIKEFKEVVNVGQYLNSQITPIEVTGKDGQKYTFSLLSDVEEKFPDGFEAKNNIEQLKFNSAIMSNESKFNNAIETLKSAEAQYTKETSAFVQAKNDNERIGKEYRAMADAGLVPKVEGDPSDPKFLDQPAIKELDKILNYMDTKNKELAEKGLGQITSVYIGKQMMENESKSSEKDNKKQDIINQRNEVASLSATPSSDDGKKKQTYTNVPMSRLADEIIAQEGLR